jgi:hypothetical protein
VGTRAGMVHCCGSTASRYRSPRTRDGEPVCEQYLDWLDNRFVYAQFGGLWDHPLLDPSKINLLGNIRGILVWDAVKRMLHVERPEPVQAWTSPLADAQERLVAHLRQRRGVQAEAPRPRAVHP